MASCGRNIAVPFGVEKLEWRGSHGNETTGISLTDRISHNLTD